MSNYYTQDALLFEKWPNEAVHALACLYEVLSNLAEWQDEDEDASDEEQRRAKIHEALGDKYSWAEPVVQELLQELYSDSATLPSPEEYADCWYFEDNDATLLVPLIQCIQQHFRVRDNHAAHIVSSGYDDKRPDAHYLNYVCTAGDFFLCDYPSNYSQNRATDLLERVILPAANNPAVVKDEHWWNTTGSFINYWRMEEYPRSSCLDYDVRQKVMQLLCETEKDNPTLEHVRNQFLAQITWKYPAYE